MWGDYQSCVYLYSSDFVKINTFIFFKLILIYNGSNIYGLGGHHYLILPLPICQNLSLQLSIDFFSLF